MRQLLEAATHQVNHQPPTMEGATHKAATRKNREKNLRSLHGT